MFDYVCVQENKIFNFQLAANAFCEYKYIDTPHSLDLTSPDLTRRNLT